MATLDTSGTQGTPVSADALTVDVSAGDPVTIPEGLNPATADFAHEGPDLVMTWPDGSQVVVTDYFMAEDQPSLMSTDGARVDGDIATRLAGSATPGQVAQVGEGVAEQPIGQVDTLSGTVTVVRADGTRVELKAGDPVYQGDILESSDDGAIGVVLADETTFSMAENGRMVLDEMVFDPGTQEGSVSISVMQGVFTFVSGQVAKTDPDAMTLNTPVATIGIRGTQIGLDLADGKEMKIALMEESDGFVGEVVISNNAGVSVLNGANEFSTISSFNLPPAEVSVMSKSELVSSFGSALKSIPTPEGSSVNNFGIESEADIEKVVEEAKAEEAAEAAEEEAEEEASDAEELADFETAAGEEEAPPTADIPLTVSADAAADAVLDIPIVEEAPPEPEPEPEPEPVASSAPDPVYTPPPPEPEPEPTVVTISAETESVPVVSDPVAVEPDPTAVDTTASTVDTVDEGGTVALNIDAAVTQGEGSIETITVSGLDGATLSAGNDDGAGTVTLSPSELTDLTLTADADSTTDLNLTITATTNDGVTATDNVVIDVVPVGDAPIITVDTPSIDMLEDGDAVDLNITVSDPNANEAVNSVTITGVDGATLSAGIDNGDGTWTLTPDQLTGLQLTPNADWNGSVNIGVSATTDQGGSATVSDAVIVNVGAVADSPIVSVSATDANADGVIEVNLTATMPTDTTETVDIVTLGGMPEGSTITVGSSTVTVGASGEVQLDAANLGSMQLTVPDGYTGDVVLSANATSTDGTTGSATDTYTVPEPPGPEPEPVDLAPELTLGGVSGDEDTGIDLNISVTDDVTAMADVSVTISGVPSGAELSAGTNNGDGTWTLSGDQLDGLKITPPENSDADFDLQVSISDGVNDPVTGTMSVVVDAVADAPTLEMSISAPIDFGEGEGGVEMGSDHAVHDQHLQGTDFSDELEGGQGKDILIGGAGNDELEGDQGKDTLIGGAGNDEIDGGEGKDTIVLSGTQDEYRITELGSTGTYVVEHVGGDRSDGIDIVENVELVQFADVDAAGNPIDPIEMGVAETSSVDVSNDDVNVYDISFNASLNDTDGSEEISKITVSDVPDGAGLSAGTDNGDGSWTLSSDDMEGLTLITDHSMDDGGFTLNVSVTSTELSNGDTETTAFDIMFADPDTLEVDGVTYDLSPLNDNAGGVEVEVLGSDGEEVETTIANQTSGEEGYTITSDGVDATVLPDS